MTIDEAIENLKYDVEIDMYIRDIAPQLAEWLEELKSYRASVFSGYMTQKMLKEEYNKAIDDFAENISLKISESIIWGMLVNSHKDNSFNDTSDKIVDYVINTANEIAEQLKAGNSNGS